MEDEDSPGLQIEEHLPSQRRGWVLERVAWIVVAIVLVAAVLGLFGNGLLTPTAVGTSGGTLIVSYERFGRYGADSVLRVEVSNEAFVDDRFTLSISTSYLDSMKIDDIAPQPIESRFSDRAAIFTFATPDAASAHVRFDMTGSDVGGLDGTVGLPSVGERTSFSQFLFP
jgi:hypothetical protein